MTPERKAYALKRINRLTMKLDAINASLIGNPNSVPLMNARRSTQQSISRWRKELEADAVTHCCAGIGYGNSPDLKA
jgi:hypothetical protein